MNCTLVEMNTGHSFLKMEDSAVFCQMFSSVTEIQIGVCTVTLIRIFNRRAKLISSFYLPCGILELNLLKTGFLQLQD